MGAVNTICYIITSKVRKEEQAHSYAIIHGMTLYHLLYFSFDGIKNAE